MYHYLISLNGTVKLLVNEQERPLVPASWNESLKLQHPKVEQWLAQSKEYDFASKEDEEKFIKLAKRVTLTTQYTGIPTELKQGILIPSEYVSIKESEELVIPNALGECAYYSEELVAHFIQPSTEVEETQDLFGGKEIFWTAVKDRMPKQEDMEVIGYSPDWVDLDFNPKGIRVCFHNGDGTFTSAKWIDYQDYYATDTETMPTHWKPLYNPPIL